MDGSGEREIANAWRWDEGMVLGMQRDIPTGVQHGALAAAPFFRVCFLWPRCRPNHRGRMRMRVDGMHWALQHMNLVHTAARVFVGDFFILGCLITQGTMSNMSSLP